MATKREKRLFIITNATHYLNVKNYIETHSIAENLVVLVIRPYDGYQKLKNKLEQDQDLEFLKVIFVGKKKKFVFQYIDIFKKMWEIKKLRKRIGKIDKVFLTNYNSWLHHFIVNQVPAAQTVLISDGTAIFSIAEKRKKFRKIPFSGNQFFVEKVLKLKPIQRLHFYSQLEIDIADYDSLEVFKFNGSKGAKINEDLVYFVGSPLVEAKYLDLEKNIQYLKDISKKFDGKQCIYFAHRREKAENLSKYKFFGEVIRDSVPFEERMKNEKELPATVVSLVSSVLINLPQVYPQVCFYYHPIPAVDITDASFKKRYLNLMENFKTNESKNFRYLNRELS